MAPTTGSTLRSSPPPPERGFAPAGSGRGEPALSRRRGASAAASSWALVRSSTSQSSPIVVQCSSAVSPDSIASSARIAAAMPSTSATVRSPVRGRSCGRYPRVPATDTLPELGRSCPAISRSSVLLPASFDATRPVRPPLAVKERSWNTGVSSGQEKDGAEQTTNASDTADLACGAGALRAARRSVDVGGRHDPGGCARARLPVADHFRHHPEVSSSPATSALLGSRTARDRRQQDRSRQHRRRSTSGRGDSLNPIG